MARSKADTWPYGGGATLREINDLLMTFGIDSETSIGRHTWARNRVLALLKFEDDWRKRVERREQRRKR